MIFGVATNEDRRQRSDKPKSRSPADLDYKASLRGVLSEKIASLFAENNEKSDYKVKKSRGGTEVISGFYFWCGFSLCVVLDMN